MKLAFCSCHGEWFCEEQLCASGQCHGGRVLVGFKWDDLLAEPLHMWHSDVSEQNRQNLCFKNIF